MQEISTRAQSGILTSSGLSWQGIGIVEKELAYLKDIILTKAAFNFSNSFPTTQVWQIQQPAEVRRDHPG